MPSDEEECQMHLKTLLTMNFGIIRSPPSWFVHELDKASKLCSRCEDGAISRMREDYEKHMGKTSYNNIINDEPTQKDISKANQTIVHYRLFTRDDLYNNLTSKNKRWYHTTLFRKRISKKFFDWLAY
jgi:hypothetical protein